MTATIFRCLVPLSCFPCVFFASVDDDNTETETECGWTFSVAPDRAWNERAILDEAVHTRPPKWGNVELRLSVDLALETKSLKV